MLGALVQFVEYMLDTKNPNIDTVMNALELGALVRYPTTRIAPIY